MNISIDKSNLSRLLTRAQPVIDRKTTSSGLENILIAANDGNVVVSATDLRITIEQRDQCTIQTPGSIAVGGRKLYEIVKELPEGKVKIEKMENDWLEISCGESLFHLPTASADEFPSMPEQPANFIALDGDLFKNMLHKTLFAVSNDESRMNLCGVYIVAVENSAGDSVLKMVATDGHRLSIAEQKVENGPQIFTGGVIVPKKALIEICNIIESADSFEAAIEKDRFFVKSDSVYFSSVLIDEDFPNYEQVVPAQAKSFVTLAKADFIACLRRVSLLCDFNSKSVTLDIEANRVNLSASNYQLGDASENMGASYDGPPIKVSFNALYLIEALKSIDGETARLEINEALAPCLIKNEGDDSHICIIMPMRND